MLTLTDQVRAWTPIVGGSSGESGQQYHYQTGWWIRHGSLVTVWSYTQFAVKGTILGTVQLKGLPLPTRNVPGFFAGTCAYFSNLAPTAALTTLTTYAGGGQVVMDLFGVEQGKYMNPRRLVGADLNDHTQLIITASYPVEDTA